MKEYFLTKITQLLALGISENQSLFQKRQTRTLNRISFFLLAINLSLLVFNTIFARYVPLALNLGVIFFICMPIFLLNYFLKQNSAKVYSFCASNSLILLYSYFGIMQNRIVNFEVLILGCALFGAFIFDSSWGILALSYSLVSFLLIGALKVFKGHAVLDTLFLGNMINYFATTIFLYGLIYMYKRDFIKSENALSESEDRLRLVIKGSNNGWWDWDLVTDKVYYSPIWWGILGYEENDNESSSIIWRQLRHPDDAVRIESNLSKFLKENVSSFEIEFRLLHKSGHYVPILCKGFILRDNQGLPIRISGSNIDLTEHKNNEENSRLMLKNITEKNEELLKQKAEIMLQSEKLIELNLLKDKLFSIIAHDIRSPFTTLLLTLNAIQDETMSEEDLREMLPDITDNANNILGLIDSLFSWARSQLDGAKVHPSLFDIKMLAEEEMNLLSLKAKQKGLILESKMLRNTEVLADKAMIELVIRNLISNAIKFCKSGDKVTISSIERDGFIEVSVKDTGKGISDINLERIFTNHVTSTQGTAGEKGTGLGLIISKEFVEKNGGKIGVESEEAEGSRFYFTVPMKIN